MATIQSWLVGMDRSAASSRLRWGFVALVASGALLSVQPARADAASTGPAPCGTAYDPYAYTAAALQQCGVTTYPLASSTALPGGGVSYNYDVPTGVVHFKVPPAGFDPLTATSSQLQEYDYAPRPPNATELPRWQKEVGDRNYDHPDFLVATDINADAGQGRGDGATGSAGSRTYNYWSGYEADGAAGAYTDSETEYTEGTFGTSYCNIHGPQQQDGTVTWTGLSSSSGNPPIDQIGTAHIPFLYNGSPPIGNHQFWFEIDPPNNSGRIIPLPYSANHGDDIDVHAEEYTSTDIFFQYSDFTTGFSKSFDETIAASSYSGAAAESILERPQLYGTFEFDPSLTNFGSWNVTWSGGNQIPFDQLGNVYTDTMKNIFDTRHYPDGATLTHTDRVLAQPGSIGFNGTFTDTDKACW